jgi:hypothetical protein
LILTFIKGEIEFIFKMAKLFPRSSKRGKPFPNEIFGNNEKYSPLDQIPTITFNRPSYPHPDELTITTKYLNFRPTDVPPSC